MSFTLSKDFKNFLAANGFYENYSKSEMGFSHKNIYFNIGFNKGCEKTAPILATLSINSRKVSQKLKELANAYHKASNELKEAIFYVDKQSMKIISLIAVESVEKAEEFFKKAYTEPILA